MKTHKLLTRHIDKAGLHINKLPNDIGQWEEFLKYVNKAYYETDDERYLLERSMEISSSEILELNNQLEDAQRIAKLGFWIYEHKSQRLHLSKELYKLFGFNEMAKLPEYSDILNLVHPDDKKQIKKCFDNALQKGEKYEAELRITTVTGNKVWVYTTGGIYKKHTKENPKLFGIFMDVSKRKQAEAQVAELNKQLLRSARSIGMADVATAILHNVGNTLNSVKVSAELLMESLKDSEHDKIQDVCELLQNDSEALADKKDLVCKYLLSINSNINNVHNEAKKEITKLLSKTQHIKEAILAQQNFEVHNLQSIEEEIKVYDLVKQALEMSELMHGDDRITIDNQCKEIKLKCDQAKVLQILVNVINNARDSLLSCDTNSGKKITIQCRHERQDIVSLYITDNGCGIEKSNLAKIFTFGFTTKAKGHGFGMHSSAIVAKELKGKLCVTSDGINKGATFSLVLPTRGCYG